MKWQNLGRSNNVEDRRGSSGKVVSGGIAGIIVIILALIFDSGDKSQLVGQLFNEVNQVNTPASSSQPLTQKQQEEQEMVSAILRSNENSWRELLAQKGIKYRDAKLVLFTSKTQSGCGLADAGTGPFYCPADETIYMDLTFFEELKTRFGAKGGDFATAYVIAHEVGHHVQNILGTSGKVHTLRSQLSEKEYNKYSVALELQADCYAGIWAHTTEKKTPFLENGDIEEALSAASAVGDDHIQKQAQGYVVPDAFTHGTSAQRVFWFKKGFQTGDINNTNTFSKIIQ